jgi:hypothetical protein
VDANTGFRRASDRLHQPDQPGIKSLTSLHEGPKLWDGTLWRKFAGDHPQPLPSVANQMQHGRRLRCVKGPDKKPWIH